MLIETTGDACKPSLLRASGINGVGQTPTADDSNTCLTFLQMLIAQWQRTRWLIWNEQEVSAVSTGALSYSIGPGEDFDTPRPDKIHAAWCRLQPFAGPNPVDLPLQIIEAREDYSQISIKDLKSLPAGVFYDSAFPVGQVYFWPVPPGGAYEMHLILKASLPVYSTLVDPLSLPDEYIEALVWSLCVRMQMAYMRAARAA